MAVLERGDLTRPKTGRLFRDVAVTVSKLTPLWDFGVHGDVPEKIRGRTVVVSNHASQADPFLISYLPWEMKWLSKKSIMKTPIVGWLMRLAGDVPVSRGDKDSAKNAMDMCRAYLERDMPIMIFPEGTRSTTNELLPFKDGAFRLAIETGADVLPVAVSGTRVAMRKYEWRLGQCRALVTVGKPISTEGMTLDDLPRLKQQAREEIIALRETLIPHTS